MGKQRKRGLGETGAGGVQNSGGRERQLQGTKGKNSQNMNRIIEIAKLTSWTKGEVVKKKSYERIACSTAKERGQDIREWGGCKMRGRRGGDD